LQASAGAAAGLQQQLLLVSLAQGAQPGLLLLLGRHSACPQLLLTHCQPCWLLCWLVLLQLLGTQCLRVAEVQPQVCLLLALRLLLLRHPCCLAWPACHA
jgi:hypothetical protein